MAKEIRVDIGFEGGGTTAIAVPEDGIEAVREAVKAANGWYSVVSLDGTETSVNLAKVVYVRVGTTSKKIGFAHA